MSEAGAEEKPEGSSQKSSEGTLEATETTETVADKIIDTADNEGIDVASHGKEATVVSGSKNDSNTESDMDSNPKTGNGMNTEIAAILALLSMAGIFATAKFRRNEKKKLN